MMKYLLYNITRDFRLSRYNNSNSRRKIKVVTLCTGFLKTLVQENNKSALQKLNILNNLLGLEIETIMKFLFGIFY